MVLVKYLLPYCAIHPLPPLIGKCKLETALDRLPQIVLYSTVLYRLPQNVLYSTVQYRLPQIAAAFFRNVFWARTKLFSEKPLVIG